jgi:hypothetical protein
MSKTVEQGKAEIVALCDYFAKNREAFHASGVKEAHVRQSLIDPFFEALGWNVANNPPVAPQYREVIPEDSIDVEGEQKAPDYTFRVGTLPKFYVEAKKCGVNINADPGPAYQLRRYGWSAKVALSVLTDFEELAVYDCTIRPRPSDKASHARIHYFRFDEYPDRWPELWTIFSREAVWSGAFDQYAASKRKRGTSEVDVEFLKEIEGWRDELARNIALRNRGLSSDDLNRAVQLTIDRLIFLRMAEDRGLESYAQLLALCSRPGIYSRFMADLCRKADDKYNSGLFHFQKEHGVTEDPDRITPGLAVDDAVLRPILERLYFEHGSPYHFGVLPVEILGTVYERFLGKVIRLTADHHAKVEEKPEVRKAGGVYYTPKYIVDYIVRQTVGRQIEGKSPAQLAGNVAHPPSGVRAQPGAAGPHKQPFRVLDMACGSGSFLLGAYKCLLDHCLKWYAAHRPQGHKKAVYMDRRTGWRLTVDEKKRILTTHIFGVDIDPQAVEVSKLSLLLKVLEGETDQSLHMGLLAFKDRALPNLADNIKCGNSLIGPDYFTGRLIPDAEEFARVNAFDWQREFPAAMKAGGFDCIIGNPPYDVLEKERGGASWPHSALADYVHANRDYAHALGGKLNLFRFFVVRSKRLVRSGGRFGMILPLAFLGDISCAPTRRSFFETFDEVETDCFPQKDNRNRRVFVDAKLSTVVLSASRCAERQKSRRITVRTYPWNSFGDKHKECSLGLDELRILDPENLPVPLVDQASWDLCRKLYAVAGARRLGEITHFVVTRGEINQTVYREFITTNSKHARLLKGVEVRRYGVNQHLHQGHREWFNEKRFLEDNSARPKVKLRRIATQRITGVDDKMRVVATIMEPPCYFADSTNSIALATTAKHTLEYLLALLNSRLFQWRFRLTSTNNNVGTNELECLPVVDVDTDNEPGSKVRTRLSELAESMLSLNSALASAKSEAQRGTIQRQIEATDAEIDRLVYDLYGLTKDEIAIVQQTK